MYAYAYMRMFVGAHDQKKKQKTKNVCDRKGINVIYKDPK